MAREKAIEVMALYYRARLSRSYRFPSELVQGIARDAGVSASLVELVLESNGVRL